jgi:single-stranded-DNA-specific exonuclease
MSEPGKDEKQVLTMKGKVEMLVKELIKVSEVIKSFSGEIRLVSHYDADGIASAAIMVRALAREGKYFHLSLVNQLSENFLKDLGREGRRMILFTDLGSGYLENIQNHLMKDGDTTVIVLDHHQGEGEVRSKNLLHVNSEDFGITEHISGSGIAYLLARAMNPDNRDLSELGIIGAIGDSQIGSIGESWGLLGLNKEILKDAELSRKIRVKRGLRLWGRYTRPVHKTLQYSVDPYIPGISGSESASVQFLQELGIDLKDKGRWRTLADLTEEENKKLASGIIAERIRGKHMNPEWIFGDTYELLDKKGELRDANEFATILNACGKMGKAYMGIAFCLNDADHSEARKILDSYRREIGKAMAWVYKNKHSIRKTDNAVYIFGGSSISEHVISNVVSIINKSCLDLDGVANDVCEKPIFAFADTDEGDVKVSARVSDSLVERGVDLKDIMVRVTMDIGGEGGGHKGAAGARIEKDHEDRFIGSVEKILVKKDLNKTEQKTQIDIHNSGRGEKYGTAESERIRTQREGREGETKETGECSEEVEGKGLVRYFDS